MKFKELSHKAQLKACSDYINEILYKNKDITEDNKRLMYLDAKQILLEDNSDYDADGNLEEEGFY